jgi:hypothetical protein
MNKCTNHLECPLIIDMDNTEASMVADITAAGNTVADTMVVGIMAVGTKVALI